MLGYDNNVSNETSAWVYRRRVTFQTMAFENAIEILPGRRLLETKL